MARGSKVHKTGKGRSCDGKKRYESKAAANAQIDSMYKAKMAITRMVPYECKYCGGWHVGHSRFRGKR